MRLLLACLLCSLSAASLATPAIAAEAPVPPAPGTAAGVAPADAPAPAPPPADQAAAPAPQPEPAATRAAQPTAKATSASIAATSSSIVFGTTATLSGTVAPAGATALVVEALAGGAWQGITTTTSGADGAWAVAVRPQQTTTYRVRAADGSTASSELTVAVAPRLTVERLGSGRTFVGAPIQLRVQPVTYTGTVTFAVRYAGRVRGTLRVQPRQGRIVGMLPSPGLGRMPVAVTAAATDTFAAGSLSFASTATAPAMRQGSSGPEVRALVRKLRQLRFHTPRPSSRYDARVGDAVLAFRKAHRMSRTKSVDSSVWRKLAVASPMQPRFAGPARHIEVDKNRQLLMVVRNGVVQGTLHVSTGATGNTPEGRWKIYQKGGSYLPKFMAFVGNYGIHGYVPVPAFPASHGCVREPVWAAGWTFRQTRMGDTVYVYR